MKFGKHASLISALIELMPFMGFFCTKYYFINTLVNTLFLGILLWVCVCMHCPFSYFNETELLYQVFKINALIYRCPKNNVNSVYYIHVEIYFSSLL
jgi:hypothetical protein